MQEIITQIKKEFKELNADLSNPQGNASPDDFMKLGKRRAELEPLITKIDECEHVKKQMLENAQIINGEQDEELIQMAVAENTKLSTILPQVEKDLEVLLLPKDPSDDKNIIVEIRAGAGGDESSLFAGSLFRMYSRYSETMNWNTEIVSASHNEVGGFKEIIFSISAKTGSAAVFSHLKYESGVHRVQRIPETEKQGRIHTSTATVAILAEAEEVDLTIEAKDLRIDTFASSGPGGQSVNTTMSAVRITHIPTNIVDSCQDGKSQHKNKDQAMKVLRSRILQKQQDEHDAEIGSDRKSQVGTGDRSEKIRTYNMPQDRVTDHRIKQNWSGVEKILSGAIEPIVQALIEEDVRLQIENVNKSTDDQS